MPYRPTPDHQPATSAAVVPHTFPVTGASVRSVLIDGEPWFVGRDIASALGYANPTRDVIRHTSDRQRRGYRIGTPGGEQDVTVISEPGLYRLAMRSTLPEAERFQDWIAEDVLPAIRRTSRYEVARPEPTKLELARDLVTALEARERLARRNAELAADVAELEPSATAWDTLADEAAGDYDVRAAAQILSRDGCVDIGQRRLFAFLRELYWIDADNEPYQAQVSAGRMCRRTTSWQHPRTGERMVGWQARVTPKGLAELHRRLGCGQTLAA